VGTVGQQGVLVPLVLLLGGCHASVVVHSGPEYNNTLFARAGCGCPGKPPVSSQALAVRMYQYILAAMDLVLGLREWAYEAESPYISGFHMRDGMQRLKCGGFRLGELAFPSPKDLTCSYPYFAAMLKPRRAGQRR